MPASFDTNGHLYPYQPIKMVMAELENSFAFNEKRKTLFVELIHFVSILEQFIFACELWINGSFITLKPKPRDIDLVIFINDDELNLFGNELIKVRERMTNLDIYFVRMYSEFHPKAFISAFDKTEWLHLFSKDRKGKSKGFAQIIIDGNK